MWPSSGWYILLGRSTQTERCFCRKSSGMCGQGIKWNQVNFIAFLPRRPDRNGATVASSPCEFGVALFEEGLDALLHVLGLHQRQQLQEDVMDVLVERLVPAHAHHALGSLDGERCVGGDLERQL